MNSAPAHAAPKPEVKSRNTPGQPDIKKALERLLGGSGGTNKPSVPAPSVPKLPAPSLPQLPKAPAVPPVKPVKPGGQTVDPQGLLDYLLGP